MDVSWRGAAGYIRRAMGTPRNEIPRKRPLPEGLRAAGDPELMPSRSAAAQRRAMQAAMAAAIMAMRTTRARTGGLGPPPGSSA